MTEKEQETWLETINDDKTSNENPIDMNDFIPKTENEKLLLNEYNRVKWKLSESSKEWHKYSHIQKVIKDWKNWETDYFNTLLQKDKKMADKVAQYFDYEDAETMINDWKENQEDKPKKQVKVKQSELDTILDRRLNERDAKREFETLMSEYEINMEDEFGQEFLDEFSDLMEWREKNANNIKKYFKKAFELSKWSKNYQNYIKTKQLEWQISGIWFGNPISSGKTKKPTELNTITPLDMFKKNLKDLKM